VRHNTKHKHYTLPEREKDGQASVDMLAGANCGVKNDSCSRTRQYARSSRGMASESLSREVDLFFAQEFFFFKQEHGSPRGSDPAKTDVILTTVLGPLRYTCYSLLGMIPGAANRGLTCTTRPPRSSEELTSGWCLCLLRLMRRPAKVTPSVTPRPFGEIGRHLSRRSLRMYGWGKQGSC